MMAISAVQDCDNNNENYVEHSCKIILNLGQQLNPSNWAEDVV